MNKETLFEININELDNPFEREKLESLPKDWLVELLVRHLKKEIKAIECIKNRNTTKSKKERFMSGETTLEKVLEILGEKENE